MIGRGSLLVAVDALRGSGKSTVSRRLAVALSARNIWTPVRCTARDAGRAARRCRPGRRRGGPPAAGASPEQRHDPESPHIRLDGVTVDAEVRGPEVTAAVSAVSAVPAVRSLLVAAQRRIIASPAGSWVEGRDIGTVVAPDADLKVYLTASAHERARRRSTEQAADLAATAADLADGPARLDPGRRPLVQAPTRWCWTPPNWASTRLSARLAAW